MIFGSSIQHILLCNKPCYLSIHDSRTACFYTCPYGFKVFVFVNRLYSSGVSCVAFVGSMDRINNIFSIIICNFKEKIMILGRSRILELVEEKNLIENFDIDCLEGAGYDLRIGRVYKIKSESFLGKSERKTPLIGEEIADEHVLEPRGYRLIETIERVNMPADLTARVLPRSSVFRCGCAVITAVVDPGFGGTLTMGLRNLSSFNFKFEKEARIAQIVFESVDGETKVYEGKYQGGKVV